MGQKFKSDSALSVKKIPNENYESDVHRAVEYTRWFLDVLGIWPMINKKCSRTKTYLSKILIILAFSLMAFVLIPVVLHVTIREKDSKVKIRVVGTIVMRALNIIKYSAIIFHRSNIKLCIEHVEWDWKMAETESDREIMTKSVNAGRSISILCIVFMFSGGMSYNAIVPLFQPARLNALNETIRPLLYPGYDIFVDSQSSPAYEIIYYTIILSACATYTVVTAACNLAAIFVTHACGQIQIMISRLNSLFDSADEKSDVLKDRVDFVIRSHCRLMRFTKLIEQLLRVICLTEVVASTLVICLLEYSMTTSHNTQMINRITYFILIVSLSFNVFIFCHIGELLKEQTYEIGRASYMIEWYNLPAKLSLSLVMIINMANYPRKLTAGGMMELSIASFGTIIKTTLTYLSLLRTMNE